MAELSKQALKVQNNTEFPNNNAGLITPSRLRGFNVDMIDSLVDEIGYTADSASWNQQIDALEQFTASASGLTTGSLLVTASAAGNVITFRKGDSSTFNVTVATGSIPDISALNQATASLQAYTASANVRFTNLESTTASLNTSVTNINTFTASTAISITNLNASSASQQVSIDSLNSKTGSYATTGSNIFVGANTFTSISASSFVSASEFIGNGSKITGITASISMPILDEGIPQGNAVSLNFTGSAISAIVVGGTAVVSVNVPDTGSFNLLTASFQAYTASTDADLAAIHQATSSLQSNSASVNVSITNLNASSASQQISIDALNTNSASVNTSISALNTFTASQSTASLVTSIDNLNQFSASALVSITNLNSATASLFTSVNNINSTTASLNTSASLALVTASFDNGTRNLTFSKGDTTTFSVNIPDVSGSGAGFLTTASFNAYTSSNDQRVSSLEVNSGSVNISVSNLNNATASLFTSASLAIVTASITNDDITFTKGDGSQFTIQVATGSFALSSSYAETASLAQFAQDIIVVAKNTTGAQLNKGTIVRIIGATGDNPLIQTASWDNDSTSANTLGFLYENIANDGFGKVITQGTILGIDTDPVLGYAAGQVLYLSSSGQYTNVVPPAPFHEVRLGQVLRAQQNNGSVYVLIQNGYELSELHDVDINTGSLANKDILAYDSVASQWENWSISGLGLAITGSNQFVGDQIITGSTSITGALSITPVIAPNSAPGGIGQFIIPFLSGSNNVFARDQDNALYWQPAFNILAVSASTGNTTMGVAGISVNSSTTGSTSLASTRITSNFGAGRNIAIAGDAAGTALSGLTGVTNPSIILQSGSIGFPLQYYAPIQFQSSQSFTDGRVTFTRNVAMLENLEVTGSITASLQEGFTFVGNAAGRTTTVATSSFATPIPAGTVSSSAQITAFGFATTGSNSFVDNQTITGSLILSSSAVVELQVIGNSVFTGSAAGNVVSASITSNTASIDFNLGNYFEITSSITPLHLNITNISPGRTSTLIISASASSSITFSPNVAQPSGSAYSGSLGSIDILSLVAFNTSKVNLVSTKNMI